MSESVVQQAMALLEGIFLGVMAGLCYDLCRIMKARIKIPFLEHGLDFIFWLCLTFLVFLWSQSAWFGTIRFYGILSIILGSVLYFLTFTRFFLWFGFVFADFLHILVKVLYSPITLLILAEKKIKKNTKNLFLFWLKWYKIESITEGLEEAMFAKEKLEGNRRKGDVRSAHHASWSAHKNSCRSDSYLSSRSTTHGGRRNTADRSHS